MIRLLKIFIIFIFSFSLIGCTRSGTTRNAVIEIGNSSHFSNKEIMKAVTIVKEQFKGIDNGKLEKLWYDEKAAEKFQKSFEQYKNTASDNIIILFGDYSVRSDIFSPTYRYPGWAYILLRDDPYSNWYIDSSGY